jgi:hypothetical protein
MYFAVYDITLPLAVHATYWIIRIAIPCSQPWSVLKNYAGNAVSDQAMLQLCSYMKERYSYTSASG